MKVRVCPNCDQHNPPDEWNCANCGESLSINVLQELQDHLVVFEIPGAANKSQTHLSSEEIEM